LEKVLGMTQVRDWVPAGVDTSTPSAARIYDFMLGGGHNFAVDRETAQQLEKAMPEARQIAKLNRAFLARVVRTMAAEGITQLLDIGSGIPTVGNVHQIAQAINPECRVLYVDRDPVAVAHSKLILANNPRTAAIQRDIRNPDLIFDSSEARRLLNFDEPMGLLFLAVLHWVPDDTDLDRLLARYRGTLAGDSLMAISHITNDEDYEQLNEMTGVIRKSHSADQAVPRKYDEVRAMFDDFELLEPGLVRCGTWRPGGPGDLVDSVVVNELLYGGVGRKP
jgi:hypothetical protein